VITDQHQLAGTGFLAKRTCRIGENQSLAPQVGNQIDCRGHRIRAAVFVKMFTPGKDQHVFVPQLTNYQDAGMGSDAGIREAGQSFIG
jgi:hypothetical protein